MILEEFNLPGELSRRRKIILGELKERTLWFIKLRWWVPPMIATGTFAAERIGVEFNPLHFLLVAFFILSYNIVFHRIGLRIRAEPWQKEFLERFTYCQVGFDYGAMFLLIYLTGGIASPFIFFFIFHITFSAIFLPRRSTFSLAFIAASGMFLITFAGFMKWVPTRALIFQGQSIDLGAQPFHMMVILGFFSGFVFIAAFTISAVMRMLEKRIVDLAELTEAVSKLNDKLNALYRMTQAIGSKQSLEEVLRISTSELARVMDVEAISVKLLSEDGKWLRYAGSHGFPEGFVKDKIVEVVKSPINRRIIEGEPFVSGHVTRREWFQFGEDLQAAGLQSVQFVPLIVEGRVTGILGAYSARPEQFGHDELDFFRQASGLVAIAIENARAYEAIENLIQERSKFMNRVAHNLRAPLAAASSMVEVMRDGYLGQLNGNLREHLERLDRRVRSMLLMINELLILARSQSKSPEVEYTAINPADLATRVRQTFEEEAGKKRLTFEVAVSESLPQILGDRGMLEEMLENLISNALKYTREGGRVGMAFWPGKEDTLRMVVSDSGIGIPKEALTHLFDEFYRASNVQDMVGTGLGLAIVKEIVKKHGGRIDVESEEGLGTTVTVHLPVLPGLQGLSEIAP